MRSFVVGATKIDVTALLRGHTRLGFAINHPCSHSATA
jgi:hypothetical protein